MLLNRTKAAVVTRRRKLGIPNHVSKIRHLWTAKQEELLGVLPDQEVADLLSRTVNGVKLRRRRLHIPAARADA